MHNSTNYLIGMMSGTSLDAVDAVLASQNPDTNRWQLHRHTEITLPQDLKTVLYRLNFAADDYPGGELHAAMLAANSVAHCYAEAYRRLLKHADINPAEIIAIGAHGQTIRHQPNAASPYTLQLLNGALLSQLTQQTVVCDFRSKDIAAGGQGAPLAPLFHQQLFQTPPPFAVVNIGGIANVSLIAAPDGDATDKISGFDCGPGNCLLDEWCQLHRQQPYDRDGRWAKQGKVLTKLLKRWRNDAYFSLPPPKSSGRDYFNLAWLRHTLGGDEAPVDVMRTLLQLTADAIAASIPVGTNTCIIVGGGAKNGLLLEAIRRAIELRRPQTGTSVSVACGDDYGIPSQQVEALGFAMLAKHTLDHRRLDTGGVTGAKQPIVLGGIYPA